MLCMFITVSEDYCIGIIFPHTFQHITRSPFTFPLSPLNTLNTTTTTTTTTRRVQAGKGAVQKFLAAYSPDVCGAEVTRKGRKSSKLASILKPLCILPQKLRFSRNITPHTSKIKTLTPPGIFLYIFFIYLYFFFGGRASLPWRWWCKHQHDALWETTPFWFSSFSSFDIFI